MPNVKLIVDSNLCTSCGTCFSACPKSTITYKETVGGHLYPVINNKCNNCGVCYDVCPGINLSPTLLNNLPEDPFVGSVKSVYIGKAKDAQNDSNSQSGGIVTALLHHLLKSGQIDIAVVAIMKSGPVPRGDVFIARNKAELIYAQKSKYTPIPMLKVIKSLVQSDSKFAFVGLPCHIHGLSNLMEFYPCLKKRVVLKIGLICDRNLTSAATDFLLSYSGIKTASEFTFRDKKEPSYPGNVVIRSKNGKKVSLNSDIRIMVKDFFTPIRCSICFDKMNIFSDITIGDPHGINNIDRKRGESIVFLRSEQGFNVLDCAINNNELYLKKIEIAQALNGQKINSKRTQWVVNAKSWLNHSSVYPNYFASLGITKEISKVIAPKIQNNSFRLEQFSDRTHLINFYRRKFFFRHIKDWLLGKIKSEKI